MGIKIYSISLGVLLVLFLGVSYLVLLANAPKSLPIEPIDSDFQITEPAQKFASGNSITPGVVHGGASIVLIPSVSLSSSTGFVSIHSDDHGKPGTLLASSGFLTQGQYNNLEITLQTPLTNGQHIFAVLHKDANGNAILDYPGSDEPATDGNGKPIIIEFIVL